MRGSGRFVNRPYKGQKRRAEQAGQARYLVARFPRVGMLKMTMG